MLELNSLARLSICVNLSDGLPNAMLEAMQMGAFPIQSNTSMANEWISNNQTGLIVEPEDIGMIENAIRKALTDNMLVDKAQMINTKIIANKLNYELLKFEIVKMYENFH